MHSRLFRLRLGGMRERLRKGATLLLFYPLYAIVCSLNLWAGVETEGRLLRAFSRGLFVGILLYPVVYLTCLAWSIRLRRRRHRIAAFEVSAWPLAYVTGLGAAGAVWLLLKSD